MKILEKAVRVEQAILRRVGRRADIARHPLETLRAVVDEVGSKVEPGNRGAQVFPYDRVAVTLLTPTPHVRATAEALVDGPPTLASQVRGRLQDRGCTHVAVAAVQVEVCYVDTPDDGWIEREYQLEFERSPPSEVPVPIPTDEPRPHELHLRVLEGRTEKKHYVSRGDRVNLGRLRDVVDGRQQVVRQNQIAFVDAGDAVSQSVSRAHAHVRFDAKTGSAHLHDDRSSSGTRVVRAGRTIAVRPSSGIGVRLQDGDEVLLGQARLRVELRSRR